MGKLINNLDRVSELTGKIASWFVLLMVLITCVVVIMRYALGLGSVLLQDVVLYLHGGLFLLGASFAFKRDAHVRVDIFYRDMSDKNKSIINMLGNIFLLQPLCLVIFFYSFGFVEFSWKIMETSPEPEGLPFVYLQKTLLLLMSFLLWLQSISEILKSFTTFKHG
ncbi:MAG: TRAP transporter small permease subunit [SAR86 cluster bacterium]|nr:TRAP transporter small permease subunit [SAR86 cluster bacterium]